MEEKLVAGDSVQSLERAIKILQTLKKAQRPLMLREISDQTGMAKSTVHRLLSTMRDADLIEQGQDGRYTLGMSLFEMGSSAASTRNVTTIARPYMQQISKELGESVSLTLLSHGEALLLSFIESTSPFHVVSRVGSKMPPHCTVQGKLMLAYLPEEDVKRIVSEQGMHMFTPATIQTYEELKDELKKITIQGYAVDDGEYHIGLTSVGAPIYDDSGMVRYCFGIVSMFHRNGSPEFIFAKKRAVEAARDISKALGYQGHAFDEI